MSQKRVYQFGDGTADGDANMRELLGGKGANLAEMSRLGFPVPPGFTITTEACKDFRTNKGDLPDALKQDVKTALAQLEKTVGGKFGADQNTMPLLVSVRSGARVSMPGMMDTILNLGLNDENVIALADKTQNPRFAWDSYRRFMQIYSNVVLKIDHDLFEEILDNAKFEFGKNADSDLTADQWREIISRYKNEMTQTIPQDPHTQIWEAIKAVFASWDNPRAATYRALHNIPDQWGTAVTIQAMVFGNLNEQGATGVAFTRNPSNGKRELYGEFLVNAQGEDVVAGLRTPHPIAKTSAEEKSMQEIMPAQFNALTQCADQLEKHFRDMQDIEFTIQDGKLWILQTRTAKRTTKAALNILVDMVDENLIQIDEALMRLDPTTLDQLLHPMLDPNAPADTITSGLPASPGAASGKIAFSADAAKRLAERGEDVILLRMETSPDDIHGMYAARGILTSRGGMTSHAAVVARGLGRPCVSGASAIRIDYDQQTAHIDALTLRVGDDITIDGTTGRVMRGIVPKIEPELSDAFAQIMQWADSARTMQIRANAETPKDVAHALRFGAEGIGLCRTEHMFFDKTRIQNMQHMIFANTAEQRAQVLAKLEPEQRKDFTEIFRLMDGKPVTIRLLDPPLHEFIPNPTDDISALAQSLGIPEKTLRAEIQARFETNPMLGHRGCRLAITYPEIYDMQIRAIFGAAQTITKANIPLAPIEIMIPLIATATELQNIKTRIDLLAKTYAEATDFAPDYCIGSMIEVPRAALCADALAEQLADRGAFFSFGTNDLTQTCFGLSRDDSASFLPSYVKSGLLAADPFVTLDQNGVGALMRIACTAIRDKNKTAKIGICGEHGGDPASIEFCEKLGIDTISCSPYRLPIARLAAAQAAIKNKT